MSFLQGLLYGGFGMFALMCAMLSVIFLIDFLIRKNKNRIFKITYVNAGKEEIEWYMGKKLKHSKLGDCYFIPALKKEGRCYMPYWGSEFEYSVANKNKKKYVPVTYIKGDYVPEMYSSKEEVEIDVIELVERKDKKDKPFKVYEKFKKKVVRNIVTPTKSSMRQFVLASDKVTDEEYNIVGGWFARHGHLIVAAGIVFIAAVVAIMMIIFSYQAGVDGAFHNTPDWAKAILDTVTQNAAPPDTP